MVWWFRRRHLHHPRSFSVRGMLEYVRAVQAVTFLLTNSRNERRDPSSISTGSLAISIALSQLRYAVHMRARSSPRQISSPSNSPNTDRSHDVWVTLSPVDLSGFSLNRILIALILYIVFHQKNILIGGRRCAQETSHNDGPRNTVSSAHRLVFLFPNYRIPSPP